MIKNCLFISCLTLLCIMHVCCPHQGDLLLRDDISVRHLAFNNIKCKVYTRTLKPQGLKISQNDSSFLNFFFWFLMASLRFIWKLNKCTNFLISLPISFSDFNQFMKYYLFKPSISSLNVIKILWKYLKSKNFIRHLLTKKPS